jgi:hypothetical protein
LQYCTFIMPNLKKRKTKKVRFTFSVGDTQQKKNSGPYGRGRSE